LTQSNAFGFWKTRWSILGDLLGETFVIPGIYYLYFEKAFQKANS
jgi:hypothetical protein